MKLEYCDSKLDLKEIIEFRKNLYKDDKNFKNNDEIIIKELIKRESQFAKNSTIIPVIVKDKSKVIATCLYIHNNAYKDYIQISFLEFQYENRAEILELIIYKAKEIGKEKEAKLISIGLNGHVNYGLGLLSKGFEYKQSFGNTYNKNYYCKTIEEIGFLKTDLVSFKRDINDFDFVKYKNILNRINRKFSYRYINKKNLKEEMKIYTNLNNEIFENHKFYYKSNKAYDYELFKDLFYLLDKEHLIFAYKEDKPIGFILWYPDFNELLSENKYADKFLFLRNLLNKRKIKTFKVVEIGVIPQYQNSGVILGLFNECLNIAKERYKTCESSWILKDNFKSKNFGLKFDAEFYKEYSVYELEI